ncbi:MAG: diguanylate cyclase, partial [Clostridiales bacterium]|nr:diguanylate cyclase [Clostridiales bacterium]
MRRRVQLDKRQRSKISICFVLATIIFFFIIINQKISYGAEIAVECDEEYTRVGEAKGVLILNSYHEGFSWTREQNNSIIAKFQECSIKVDIMNEFIDWKNYPYKESLEYLHEYFIYKYSSKKIDIIIATDDIALNYALGHRRDVFSDAPIIFSGVNEDGTEDITSGFDRLTGVVEVIDPTKTIETALKINPFLKNIYVVFDNSESGLSTGKIVMDKIEKLNPNLNLIPCNDMIYDDLIEGVKVLEEDSIVYITTYFKDVLGRVIDSEYATYEISHNSTVPVYHLYDFGLNNGILGGSLLSGRVQGELATNLAKRVLQGENIDDIPIVVEDSMVTVYDYVQLKRFGISPKLLPDDAEIINKPFSFYETYRGLVNSVIIAFAVLIAFVIVLLGYIKRIRKMRRELSENHEELTQTYEELTASDDEIRKQYDEMLIINERIRVGEEKLLYLAYHDSLTGILNKHSLLEASDYIFTKDKGKVALFFIDIDNFKYVNDTMGHAFGDQLIIMVCARLSSLLNDNASLYRHSGDEFIFILENISEMKEAEKFARKLLDKFNVGFELQGSYLYVGISMGIVMYPDHGERIEKLLE